MSKDKDILILGIGAIGGFIAGRIIQAGYEPTLVTNNSIISKTLNRDGIRIVKDKKIEQIDNPKVYTSISEIPPNNRFDIVFLIMKANHVVEAATNVKHLLKLNGFMVTFQNGIVEEAVSNVIGKENLITGIIVWGGTMHEPGKYEKTSKGKTFIGELNGTITARLSELESILSTSAPVVLSNNIRGAQWSKLGINCTISTFGALTGEILGKMLKSKEIRKIFLMCYREVVDTAEALEITLEKITSNPRMLYLDSNAGKLKQWYKDLLVRFVGRKYGKLKSSMLQSLERGRKTEINYLNGYVAQKGKEMGVNTRVNDTVTHLIIEIEERKRSIAQNNIENLLELLKK
ncbi:MAG: ketopantoate reductase family protein [Candidatus Hodarchaeales archaeon]